MQVHNLQLGEDVQCNKQVVLVHNLQLGEYARCDKHDEDNNNSDEMVGSHKYSLMMKRRSRNP